MKHQNFKKGFTLLEILMVIALLGILATSVLPSFNRIFRVSVQSSVRRYSALVRFTYDQAILTGRLHRIVLNLDRQKWTVEVADPGALPVDKAAMGLLPEGISEKEVVLEEPGFKKIKGNFVDQVPPGVKIVAVQGWRMGREPITKGEVAIYAFPNGFMDEATVYLAESGKEGLQQFKVKNHPLTGRTLVEVENKR